MSKIVKITKNNGDNNFIIAQLIQIYNGEEQVLQTKKFSNEKKAKNWARIF